ncbi:MAG: hypothetical protein FWD14_05060 [Treponema sp.]|nr:hypothetical protein [Treponema sp.]
MKKILVLFVVLFVMAFIIGCASAPAAPAAPSANLQIMPSWFNQVAPPDEIWGVGFINLQNASLAMQTATASAQTDAARQLGSLVKAQLVNYANESGLQSNPRSMIAIENIENNIVNMNLSGAVVNAREQTSDGTWWVRVAVKKAEVSRQVNSIVNNEMADFAEFRADQALRRLEAELNRSR